jgi:hypothetical protein
LSALTSGAELEDEILAAADLLAGKLGTTIDHFAYPFGDAGHARL